MHASRHRATSRLLTCAAFTALALTGCGGTPEGPAATPTPVPATVTATAPAAENPFAGTKQFATTDRAWTEGGLTRLSVRSAEKKVNTQFDTWEIVPGTGEFVMVTLAKDARVLLTVPIRDDAPGTSGGEPLPTSQAEFVTLLTQLDPRTREGAGFDLSFDGEGRVTKVQSLYKP
ncbi:hypothetical protein [Streptomyces anulatus]|uniref:hypothetical protein n=1 Tax=Streptomyces anulatus TaxID=1892 RepID=UPI0033D8B54D